MEINIVYPFIDLRHFSISKSEVTIDQFQLPSPSNPKPFVRGLGRVSKKEGGFSYCFKGIKLHGENIKGLSKLRRKLCFPFMNNIMGVYYFMFKIDDKIVNEYSIDKIILYLTEEISFTISNLVNKKEIHSKCLLKDLSKELKLQYYWATRKLVKEVALTPDTFVFHKLYELKNGIITIDNYKEELKEVVFGRPFIFFETKLNYELKGKSDYVSTKLSSNIKFNEYDQFDIFHLKKGWYSKLTYRNMKTFIDYFIKYYSYFNSLNLFLDNLNKIKDRNNNNIEAFIYNISHFNQTQFHESNRNYFCFSKFHNVMQAFQGEYINNLIYKVNSSQVLPKKQKKDLLDSLRIQPAKKAEVQ